MLIQRLTSISMVLWASVACSHTTSIVAKPAGTTIFVNDEKLGNDHVNTSTPNGLGGSYKVRARAEGLAPLEVTIHREHISTGALWGSVGACLGAGCTSAVIGAVIGSGGGGGGSAAGAVCCGLLGGFPGLTPLLWLHRGPDAISIDLEARTVTTDPETKLTIKGGGAPSAPAPQKDIPEKSAAESPVDEAPAPSMQPFDY